MTPTLLASLLKATIYLVTVNEDWPKSFSFIPLVSDWALGIPGSALSLSLKNMRGTNIKPWAAVALRADKPRNRAGAWSHAFTAELLIGSSK